MIGYSSLLLASLMILTCYKNNNIEIKGKLTNPIKGEYIYHDKLSSSKLVPVDSIPLPDDTTMRFTPPRGKLVLSDPTRDSRVKGIKDANFGKRMPVRDLKYLKLSVIPYKRNT